MRVSKRFLADLEKLSRLMAAQRVTGWQRAQVLANAFNREARRKPGLSFVAFCRMIDPSIPRSPLEYRKHRAYNALAYLRRVYINAGRREGQSS